MILTIFKGQMAVFLAFLFQKKLLLLNIILWKCGFINSYLILIKIINYP